MTRAKAAPTTNMSENTETVKVAPHTSNRECYHAPDCDRAGDNYTEFTRSRAERSGLRPCAYCLGEIEYDDRPNPDRSYYEYALKAE